MESKPTIILTVISDLHTDQRVHKVATSLHNNGYNVLLVGRYFKNDLPLNIRVYKTHRIKCFKKNGAFAFIEFMIRLFFYLWFKNFDAINVNDLEPLLPCYLHAKLRSKIIIYDSHEYYTGTPSLLHRNFKRKIWQKLEQYLLPKIKYKYTVNKSVANAYFNDYGVHFDIIQNMPFLSTDNIEAKYIVTKPYEKIILMQGAAFHNYRGAEEAVLAMKYLPNTFHLLIIGGGDTWQKLQQIIYDNKLQDKVTLHNKVPFNELKAITKIAWLGLTLDIPIAPNALYSLPNKVFDYIHGNIPFISSPLPEIQHIVNTFNVGVIIPKVEPEIIAIAIQTISGDLLLYQKLKQNTINAALNCNWDKEELQLIKIYNKALNN